MSFLNPLQLGPNFLALLHRSSTVGYRDMLGEIPGTYHVLFHH